jgi:long-chain acyl-CoA synthetase
MTIQNLPQLHRLQCERFAERPAVRFKNAGSYRDLSWKGYRADVEAAALGLIGLGVQPGETVALLAENRLEWLLADWALLTTGAITVPLHSTLPPSQIQFQLGDAEVGWIIVSTREQWDKVAAIRAELPRLRGIIALDRVDDSTTTWQDLLEQGRRAVSQGGAELRRREEALTREDLATIIYTSGTTGNPKGVMLTHGNLLSNAQEFAAVVDLTGDVLLLNWLPLSHIYARTVDHYVPCCLGMTVALAESADTLVQNLAEVQPTHMSCVPRFYEKLYAMVRPAPDWQRRLRGVFGARLQWLGSGGAPLPRALAQVYEDAGLVVLQGYGLTEASPVISINRHGHNRLGTVGQALPGVEIRIAEDGEILTRGPHVMKGYWKLPDATADAIRDGWLHTGDLGTLDAEGFLTITGRKKDLIVLSSGKKVAPSVVEGVLQADPMIDQVVVFGEGKNFLSALIVPNWGHVRAALKRTDAAEEALTRDPEVRAFFERRLEQTVASLASWEQIKRFVLVPQPFSVAREELTVSMKLRRNVVHEHHRQELEALYNAEIEAQHDSHSLS